MILSYDNKALRKADQTGNYVARRTKHRAWFQRGAPLPPGYEPDEPDESDVPAAISPDKQTARGGGRRRRAGA